MSVLIECVPNFSEGRDPAILDTLTQRIAAVAGATLGEIVRAIRINDRPCAPVTPVTLTRAAAALEGK